MIKGVAFDLEGTVVDVEAAHHQAHLHVARDIGLTIALEEALTIPYFIGGPDEKVMEELYRRGDKSLSVKDMLVKDKHYYQEHLAKMQIKPRKGFLQVIDFLKKNRYKIAIGSLTAEKEARFLLEQSGLTKIFDPSVIVLREHVKELKPAPDVFLETARRMHIRPEEQLVFEDSPRGVMAALKAGSKAVGMPVYNNPKVMAALQEAGAKYIFETWYEVDIQNLIS